MCPGLEFLGHDSQIRKAVLDAVLDIPQEVLHHRCAYHVSDILSIVHSLECNADKLAILDYRPTAAARV